MRKILLTLVAALPLCMSASADVIAQWDFNTNPSDFDDQTGTYLPVIGTGVAAPAGGATSSFIAAKGSSDLIGADPNNSCWRLLTFPTQGTSNKISGVQYTVDTSGYQNITLTWDQLNTGPASKYWRVQYSTDNGATWIDYDVIINTGTQGSWINPITTVSFVSVPGANNNPNFGVRIVSEFQSTATGAGADAYVPMGTTYATTGTFKTDMVIFNGTTVSANVEIITDPASQTVAVGQPVTFSVVAAGGTTPITYQWRKNTATIADATNSIYSISPAQHTNAGSYDVMVDNGVNSRTSNPAILTVRDPLTLAWTGLNGFTWDGTSVNWVDTVSLAGVAYTSGDHVLFDSRGQTMPTIYLGESLQPSSVTVDADSDYLWLSAVNARIEGATGLTKRGTGTLTVDTDNSYSGPTVIEAGTVQLGLADAHGSLGTGPITNNGAMVFNRSDNVVLGNDINGSGSLLNIGQAVTLSGANTYNGPIAVQAGSLILMGNQTLNSTNVIVTASAATGVSGATKFGLSGGIVVGSGTTLRLSGSTAVPDCRCALLSTTGSNIFGGPIILDGGGNNAFQSDGIGTELHLNGNVSGPDRDPGASLSLRGTGSGVLNGTITLSNSAVHKTDSGTWTISSTGNSWSLTMLALGTLRLGANDALPTELSLIIGQAGGTATLDLAGFNQQIAALTDNGGTEVIGNSSVVSDSTLTVGSGAFGGTIRDTLAGGSRKVSLTVAGTTLTLTGVNTYSGETTVSAGTLALSGAGDIASTPVINLTGGALDVSARNDGTLPLHAGQTLKGNGMLMVTGNLTNNGTLELKVNKTGGVVTNDKVAVTGQIGFGGTLRLVLSGEALTLSDSLPVASAGSFGGEAFASIQPAVPAPGLAWDTSTLTTDGILRITGAGGITITAAALSPSGDAIVFSGTGGVAGGTFTVLASTNVAEPLATWVTAQTGSFDGDGKFGVTIAIVPGAPKAFFSLQVP